MAGDAGNSPPRFKTLLQDVVFVEGEAATFSFPSSVLEDPDGDTLHFTWSAAPLAGGTAPPWLSFSSSSILTLQGTAPPNSPDYRITVTVTDGQNNAIVERFVLVTSGSANRAPALATALGDQTWIEGVAGSFTVASTTFADPDNDVLVYSARLISGAALPTWLTFDPAARAFTGTPPANSDDFAVRVTANDPKGASAFADFAIRTGTSTVLNGSSGPDVLDGTAGADTINAGAGDDIVSAGSGIDTIDGGAGADRINGGPDTDAALYPGSRGDYLLSRTTGGVVTVADRFGTMDTLNEVENLQFGGSVVATSSLPYQPAVNLASAGVVDPVYRFYNVRDKAYFYTAVAQEKDTVVRESTDAAYTPDNGIWPYFYQGSTFGQATAAGVPVYRFYNTQTGHHFFTVSEAERALVRRESTDPSYTPDNGLWPFVDEGIGFRAYFGSSLAGSVPVFRFFSTSLNRHFFTASTDEAQQIRQTGLWTDEGIGFWAAPLSTNRAPTISSALADQSWREGQAGSYQFPATSFGDADSDALSYSAATSAGAGLPAWLSFSAATRTFSGSAPVGSDDVSVRVTANDGKGGSVFDDFAILTLSANADDYSANTSSTGSVSVGGSTTGTIESAGDSDWFRINLTAGRAYTIDLEGSANSQGTLGNPRLLGVHDSAGNALANTSNDDLGSKSNNARVNFTPTASGEYFISAGSTGTGTGSYRLKVSGEGGGGPDDYAGSTSTTGRVQPAGSATGNIEAGNDRDWFRVTLNSGQSYTVDLEGASTGQGTLADPYLHGIYDSGGKAQFNTSNDNQGGNTNARVTFSPGTSGEYYISAGAAGAITGTYTLKVSAGTQTGGTGGKSAGGANSLAGDGNSGGSYVIGTAAGLDRGLDTERVILVGIISDGAGGSVDG